MNSLPTELFDYPLPTRLIAQTPADRRDQSRLLVVDRKTRRLEHRVFADIGDYLQPGDTLFRNNAAVLPARLLAQRPTGGAVECFLLRPTDHEDEWWCLLRPGKKLPIGAQFDRPDAFRATVIEKDAEGLARVAFEPTDAESMVSIANRLGEVPLPPYIVRQHTDGERQADLDRYQTVYANHALQVAVAAPTAGLHFTTELLSRLTTAGIGMTDVTLNVGLGTFKPVSTDTIEAHSIHRENYRLSANTQAALFPPLRGRRLAVGTTTVRTVEDFLGKHTAPLSPAQTYHGEASVFLFPPCRFQGIDGLVTNFHQPRSTLLCLVAAFLCPGSLEGIAWLKEIYREAIAREYRFFSYGDAMLIV